MRWFSLESPVVERKYVFTRFKAENDISLTALVAGMTSNSLPRVEILLNSFLQELPRDSKKVTKSLTSNSEVSNPMIELYDRQYFETVASFDSCLFW